MKKEAFTLEDLRDFVVRAHKHGYALGNGAPIADEADGSKTIVYRDGEWEMRDSYFGGEPFGGREVAFFGGKPVWFMGYYGYLIDSNAEPKIAYGFLREALALCPEEYPYRGPAHYESKDGMFRYDLVIGRNETLARFRGEEHVFQANLAKPHVYAATFAGGLICRR